MNVSYQRMIDAKFMEPYASRKMLSPEETIARHRVEIALLHETRRLIPAGYA